MYAFGAMLSFTIAHASVIALRVEHRDDELEWRARPNLTDRRDRLAAVRDRRRPRHRRRLARRRRPGRADALRGPRLARRRVRLLRALPARLGTAAHADVAGAGAARRRRSRSSTARSSCRSSPATQSREAVEVAARLATERAGRIVLLRVIVVPLELPLDADLAEQLEDADELLDEARAVAAPYGVRTVERVVRARNAGRAIVEEAERRGTEIIVLGAPRGHATGTSSATRSTTC